MHCNGKSFNYNPLKMGKCSMLKCHFFCQMSNVNHHFSEPEMLSESWLLNDQKPRRNNDSFTVIYSIEKPLNVFA